MTGLAAVLPNESAAVEPRRIVELAREAERLGFDTVWLPDHLLPPSDFGATYGGVYEPLVLLGAIAAATERIRLGTSVLVLPLRDPFLLAKQTATLERLAPGRVILGVGVGWDAAEFAALGADFTDRGRRTDEALRLIRHLHTTGAGPFEGQRFGFDTGVFEPRLGAPVPVMVGGGSDAALRRAARYAEVWQGVNLSAEAFADRVATLRALTDRPVRVGMRVGAPDEETLVVARRQAREFVAAGAQHVAVWPGGVQGWVRRLTAFRDGMTVDSRGGPGQAR